MSSDHNHLQQNPTTDRSSRRRWLKGLVALGAGAAGLGASQAGIGVRERLGMDSRTGHASALTREKRNKMTPDEIIAWMLAGNARFRTGNMKGQDYLAQMRATAGGQYPAAAILSCVDSRAPAEILMDMGIGDAFNARVAGNIFCTELLGSMEFACAVAGAKVIMVMGHTGCGAVKGAINRVKLENVTRLVEAIQPAVAATPYDGERTGNNEEFVNLVVRTNVNQTLEKIRSSNVLKKMEDEGKIKAVGAIYHLSDGRMEVLPRAS